jgi:hypothetical protein
MQTQSTSPDGPITRTVKEIFMRKAHRDYLNMEGLIKELHALLHPKDGEPDWDDVAKARQVIRSHDCD